MSSRKVTIVSAAFVHQTRRLVGCTLLPTQGHCSVAEGPARLPRSAQKARVGAGGLASGSRPGPDNGSIAESRGLGAPLAGGWRGWGVWGECPWSRSAPLAPGRPNPSLPEPAQRRQPASRKEKAWIRPFSARLWLSLAGGGVY